MNNIRCWRIATYTLFSFCIGLSIYIWGVLAPMLDENKKELDNIRTERLLLESNLVRMTDRLKVHENSFGNEAEKKEVEKRIFDVESDILDRARTVEDLRIVMDKIFLHSPNLVRFPCLFPIRPGEAKVSSTFGKRVAPKTGASSNHKGIDYAAPIGTPVYAAANGVVTEVSRNAGGYGKKVVVRHGFGFETVYGHLSDFNVTKGDSVGIGKIIAFVGNTGISTGPHLHYEIRKNGLQIDPMELTRIVERKIEEGKKQRNHGVLNQ